MATPNPPKCPHLMRDVYAQIHAHPDFDARATEGLKVGLQSAEFGYSWTTKENNKWVRKIWAWLYLDGPKP